MVLAALLGLGLFGRPSPSALLGAPGLSRRHPGRDLRHHDILAVPRVGTAVTLGSIICDQLIGALLIDTFGWLSRSRSTSRA